MSVPEPCELLETPQTLGTISSPMSIYLNLTMILQRKLFTWSRSEHMKKLHASGRYLGTSKIGLWNVSGEKRDRMSRIRSANQTDKTSRGYGSEYHMRVANRTLLSNKFQSSQGYIYFVQFPDKIKVGFSKEPDRRLGREITGGNLILLLSGPTNVLAQLEFDTFLEFQDYTLLDPTLGRYTEYLDPRVSKQVYDYLLESVSSDPTRGIKIEKQNKLK